MVYGSSHATDFDILHHHSHSIVSPLTLKPTYTPCSYLKPVLKRPGPFPVDGPIFLIELYYNTPQICLKLIFIII